MLIFFGCFAEIFLAFWFGDYAWVLILYLFCPFGDQFALSVVSLGNLLCEVR